MLGVLDILFLWGLWETFEVIPWYPITTTQIHQNSKRLEAQRLKLTSELLVNWSSEQTSILFCTMN